MVEMDIKHGDIIVFKTADKIYKNKVSKIDGNIVKLFTEDGLYRQMPINIVKDLIKDGFASILKQD